MVTMPAALRGPFLPRLGGLGDVAGGHFRQLWRPRSQALPCPQALPWHQGLAAGSSSLSLGCFCSSCPYKRLGRSRTIWVKPLNYALPSEGAWSCRPVTKGLGQQPDPCFAVKHLS